jgi:hypothetical protein
MLLALNLLLLLLSSNLLARLLMGECEGWRVLLGTIALIPLVIWFVTLPLGALQTLTASHATIFLAILTAMIILGYASVRKNRESRISPASATPPEEPAWRTYVAFAAAITAVLATTARLLVRGPGLTAEDSIYHASFAANAIITGGFADANFFWVSYYPYNADLVPLWLFLHTGTDGVVVLGGILFLVLLAVSGSCLVHACGLSRSSSFLMAALLALVTIVNYETQHFASADLAGAAMTLAAVAFVLPRRQMDGDAFHTPSVVLAGLLSGWALGSKALFLCVPALIFCWLLFWSHDRTSKRKRLALAGWFALSATLTGSYWYLHNIVLTGNPLFPGEFGLFAGPFVAEIQRKTTLLSTLLSGRSTTDELWRVATEYTQWPPAVWVLSVLGYVSVLVWRPGMKFHRSDGISNTLWLIAILGGVLLLLFPVAPFSGTYDVPDGKLIAVPRYVLLPFTLGVIAFILSTAGTRLGFLVGLGAAVLALWGAWGISGIGLCALTYVLVRWIGAKYRPGGSLRVITAGVLIGLAGGIILWIPYISQVADRNMFSEKYFDDPRGQCWQFLERLPAGAHVTWFGPSSGYYQLFGRRLQLAPIAVDANGKRVLPLHEQWKRDPLGVQWWSPPRAPDPETFVDNLVALGIQYVVLQKTNTGWPPQEVILMKAGLSPAIYEDTANKIFCIGQGRAP